MIYWQLFWAFFKIGALGFGGGMAIIQLISDSIKTFVAMTPAQFAEIVAVAQVTPGPVAVNAATYVGYESAGIAGAFVATFGVVMPAFIIVLIVSRSLVKYNNSRAVQGALDGIKPATVGMVAAAAITIGEPVVFGSVPLGTNFAGSAGVLPTAIDIPAIIIVAATVILIGKYKFNAFKVLIAMAIIGAALGA